MDELHLWHVRRVDGRVSPRDGYSDAHVEIRRVRVATDQFLDLFNVALIVGLVGEHVELHARPIVGKIQVHPQGSNYDVAIGVLFPELRVLCTVPLVQWLVVQRYETVEARLKQYMDTVNSVITLY